MAASTIGVKDEILGLQEEIEALRERIWTLNGEKEKAEATAKVASQGLKDVNRAQHDLSGDNAVLQSRLEEQKATFQGEIEAKEQQIKDQNNTITRLEYEKAVYAHRLQKVERDCREELERHQILWKEASNIDQPTEADEGPQAASFATSTEVAAQGGGELDNQLRYWARCELTHPSLAQDEVNPLAQPRTEPKL